MTFPSASICRVDNPLPCVGRRAERESGVGIWIDPDSQIWYWSPSVNGEPQGITAITHCPHCGGPLPRPTAIVAKLLGRRD